MTVVQTSPVARRPLRVRPHSSPHPSPPTITVAVVILAAVGLAVLFSIAMTHEDTLRQPDSEGPGAAELTNGSVLLPKLPALPTAGEVTAESGAKAGESESTGSSTQAESSTSKVQSTGSTSGGSASGSTDGASSTPAAPAPASAAEPATPRGSLTAVDSSGGRGALFDASAPAGTFTPGAELVVRLDGRTMSVLQADSAGAITAVIGWVDDPNPPAPGSHTLEIGEIGGNSVTTTIVVPEPPG